MKIDLSNLLAVEMDKALNSEENKQMFSTSSMLEKLAFKKVSEEDAETEVEKELVKSFSKTASCKHCECKNTKHDKCNCDCHDTNNADAPDDKIDTFPAPSGKGINAPYVPGTTPPVKETKKSSNSVRDAFHSLLKISEVLDDAGYEKISAMSILLADKLIVEAKAKSSKKSDKKSKEDKSKSKGGKKMDMKERMKKMRDAQKGKGKKDDKKSKSKKSEAQVQPTPQHMEPKAAPKRESDIILGALDQNVRPAIVALEVMPSAQMGVRDVLVRFKPGQEKAFDAVMSTINTLVQQNQLPGKKYNLKQV
jgi:hypothetical protein